MTIGGDKNANQEPESDITDPVNETVTVGAGETVSFTLNVSDPDGNLAGVEWYVDGKFVTENQLEGEHDSNTWNYTFNDSGTHTVQAVAFDGERTYESNLSSRTVTVSDDANRDSSTGDSTAEIRSVYVWGYADTLVTDDAAADRFFERAENEGYNTVYLSADVIYTTSSRNLSAFIGEAHEHGMEVDAMVGFLGANSMSTAEQYTQDIVAYNSGRDNVSQFDGVHFDIEPKSGESVGPFLDEYSTMLDGVTAVGANGETVASQNLTVSADVGWWWARDAPDLTRRLVEHKSFDYITVMAYYDTTEKVRDRLSMVVSDIDKPYVLAVESGEYPGTTPDHRASFYEEGPEAMHATIDDIEASPPSSDNYLGTAIHYYGSAVSTWDSLRDTRLSTKEASPGDVVEVDVSVLFDDGFPTSAHRSTVFVQFKNNDTVYTTETTVEPPSGETATRSIEWTVPADVPAGQYEVTVLVLDTTFEDANREATQIRTNPIELDRDTVGTVSIGENVSTPE